MAKIKHTKNELKAQREALARYLRFLPTLELKKTQLVAEIRRITNAIERVQLEYSEAEQAIFQWVDVMAEPIDLKQLLSVTTVQTTSGNIAGIDIPLFEQVIFDVQPYDPLALPLWVDWALEALQAQLTRLIQIQIYQQQIQILQEELRITIQRINLFEKVKIPETRENIRVIQIFLGDAQTAEVVRGKIAKAKIQKKSEAGLA